MKKNMLILLACIVLVAWPVGACSRSQVALPAQVLPPPAADQPNVSPEAPERVVEQFFQWYLEGGRLVPLEERLYQESELLTERFKEKLDRYLEERSPYKNNYDPIVYADEMPETISVEALSLNENRGRVLVHKDPERFAADELTVDLVQNQAGWQIDDIQGGNPNTPEGVALLFFYQHIQGYDDGSSEYLSEDYRREIAEIKEGFEGPGSDPVLNVQIDVPGPITVKNAVIAGEQAEVHLQIGPMEHMAYLERIDGQWKIAPPDSEGKEMTPQETVEVFYDWYLGYIGSGEDFRNPLVDRAYRTAPNLHFMLVEEVDQLGSGPEGFMFDPFLCAQMVPADLETAASFYNDGRPVVLVGNGVQDYYFTVELLRTDFNQWAIRKIGCNANPQTLVKGFYTWVLGYLAQQDDIHASWSGDWTWKSQFLSPTLIEAVDLATTEAEGSLLEQFLLSPELPESFETEACPQGDCVLVNLLYEEASARQIRVELAGEARQWRIEAIENP